MGWNVGWNLIAYCNYNFVVSLHTTLSLGARRGLLRVNQGFLLDMYKYAPTSTAMNMRPPMTPPAVAPMMEVEDPVAYKWNVCQTSAI